MICLTLKIQHLNAEKLIDKMIDGTESMAFECVIISHRKKDSMPFASSRLEKNILPNTTRKKHRIENWNGTERKT